jgi:hypothetical protein
LANNRQIKSPTDRAQIGFPFQYFNSWRRSLWSFIFLCQMAVSKLLPWLMPPPTFMMVQDAGCV